MTATWRNQAACAGMNPDLFYPERGATLAHAKAVCAGCPVAADCLDHALTNGERHGIWGGKSEQERGRIRRAAGSMGRSTRTPAKCGTEAGYTRHIRNGETACPACLDGKARAQRDRNARRDSGAA